MEAKFHFSLVRTVLLVMQYETNNEVSVTIDKSIFPIDSKYKFTETYFRAVEQKSILEHSSNVTASKLLLYIWQYCHRINPHYKRRSWLIILISLLSYIIHFCRVSHHSPFIY
jgi:hypothetical protein